ncbi:MAG: hypothetical protein K1X75_03250 [Leptospirales bacterium]|nr:hypothetical protein [Leptospirales bacterium]
MKLTTAVLPLLATCLFACQWLPQTAADRPELPDRIRALWLSLPQSVSQCSDYDYFPDGGLRNFACHLATPAMYAQLQREVGLAVFLSGPHSAERLNLSSRNSFGHYNPRFVRFLLAHALPAGEDPAFRNATQPIWDSQVRSLALKMLVSYRKLRRNPQLLEQESARFLALLQNGQLPEGYYQRYFWFMNPEFQQRIDQGDDYFYDHGFDGGWDGNVIKTCTAFWIRRHIDGTDHLFYQGLRRSFEIYEPQMLESDD